MRKAFERLGPRLGETADRLGRIIDVTYSDRSAELVVERIDSGITKVFPINVLKTGDGAWKLDGM